MYISLKYESCTRKIGDIFKRICFFITHTVCHGNTLYMSVFSIFAEQYLQDVDGIDGVLGVGCLLAVIE